MEQSAVKHVLIGLSQIIRDQHLEIEHLTTTVTEIRNYLGPEADAKIDRSMRDSLKQASESAQLTDETLLRLERIIHQLQQQ